MVAMNRERLLMLRDHMLRLQARMDAGEQLERQFNMQVWGATRRPQPEGVQCVTAACLLGEAALITEFNVAGLRMDFAGVYEFNGQNLVPIVYSVWSDDEAGEEFFGLEPAEAEYLFMPTSYVEVRPDGVTEIDFWARLRFDQDAVGLIKPRDAARHIDEVLEGRFRE